MVEGVGGVGGSVGGKTGALFGLGSIADVVVSVGVVVIRVSEKKRVGEFGTGIVGESVVVDVEQVVGMEDGVLPGGAAA